MKKQLFITWLAIVTAIFGIVALGTNTFVDASNSREKSQKSSHEREREDDDDKGHKSENKRNGWNQAGFATGVNTGALLQFGLNNDDLGKWLKDNSSSIAAALEGNNYTAFIQAVGSKGKNISQERFNKIRAIYIKQKAIVAALEANNYAAYAEAIKPTQDEFNAVVTKYKKFKANVKPIKLPAVKPTSTGSTSTWSTSTGTVVVGYTLAEVQAHNTSTNCRTAVNGNVYNVTSWISQHPGGSSSITAMCGIDASGAFNGQHGGQARPVSELASFKIGILK